MPRGLPVSCPHASVQLRPQMRRAWWTPRRRSSPRCSAEAPRCSCASGKRRLDTPVRLLLGNGARRRAGGGPSGDPREQHGADGSGERDSGRAEDFDAARVSRAEAISLLDEHPALDVNGIIELIMGGYHGKCMSCALADKCRV
jgi:hypothetical protein